MSVKTRTAPATDPQVSFINTLLTQRVVDAGFAGRVQDKIDSGTLTKSEASDAIGYLKARPYVPRETKTEAPDDLAVTESGMYEVDGTVYQVKWNRSKTNLYAMRLDDEGYEYAPGAMRKITSAHRISVDRAIELSGARGQCVRCLRTLKDPKSIKQSMGPVCIKKV